VGNVIVYGNGPVARIVYYCLRDDSSYTVRGFTVDSEMIEADEFLGLPLVDFNEVSRHFSPDEHRMFIAVGYLQTNRLRAERYRQAREMGYSCVSYVSSHAAVAPDLVLGENCFVGANVVIQPTVQIGDNVTVRDQSFVGHDTIIGDHCFLAAGATIAGKVTIEPYSLLGVNATVKDGVRVGEGCIIGAGVTLLQDAQAKEVYMSRNAQRLPLSSDEG